MNKFVYLTLMTLGLCVFLACNNKPNTPEDIPRGQDLGKCPALPADPNAYPKPRMWVDGGVSTAYEKNFHDMASYAKTKLPNNEDETDSFYYDAQEFKDMLDSFSQELPNIKFVDLVPAVFSAKGQPGVPANRADDLVFLFRTYDSVAKKSVYYLLPENAKSFSTADDSVHTDTVTSWLDNYQRTVIQWFNAKYLDTNDKCNYQDEDASDVGKLSNTRGIRYFLQDMQELPAEICYQAQLNKDTIVGYQLYFSAFPDKGKGHQDAYSNRLMSQLEFMTRDKTTGIVHPFYLESTPNWKPRPPQPPRFTPITFVHLFGLDNGQLCPPRCTD
jgi:hypothetical protein